MLFLFILFPVILGNPVNNLVAYPDEASQLESPWFALLTIYDLPCGGTLINKQYIVTAAHCFDGLRGDDFDDEERLRNAIKIKLGEWKTDTNPDCDEDFVGELCEKVVEILPKAVMIHPEYTKLRGTNKYGSDIALLKLSWPPRKSALISDIDLPEADECRAPVENELFTVTGFGQLPSKEYSKIKKKIDMKIISHEECENEIGDRQEYYDKKTHICGKGTKGETTCKGDSGSGVTKNSNDGSILQGIVSFGVTECGKRRVPSGFVKVACFVEWIDKEMDELGDGRDKKSEEDEDSPESGDTRRPSRPNQNEVDRPVDRNTPNDTNNNEDGGRDNRNGTNDNRNGGDEEEDDEEWT